MKELIKKSWNYTLYQKETQLILSVICGTVGLYEVNIILTPEEMELYKKEGIAYTDQLAENIRYDPDKYGERHIKLDTF